VVAKFAPPWWSVPGVVFNRVRRIPKSEAYFQAWFEDAEDIGDPFICPKKREGPSDLILRIFRSEVCKKMKNLETRTKTVKPDVRRRDRRLE
jgi:hypothetical protein